jgi:hypothetical protein
LPVTSGTQATTTPGESHGLGTDSDGSDDDDYSASDVHAENGSGGGGGRGGGTTPKSSKKEEEAEAARVLTLHIEAVRLAAAPPDMLGVLCEDCNALDAPYGLRGESRRRWCRGCAATHSDSNNNGPRIEIATGRLFVSKNKKDKNKKDSGGGGGGGTSTVAACAADVVGSGGGRAATVDADAAVAGGGGGGGGGGDKKGNKASNSSRQLTLRSYEALQS